MGIGHIKSGPPIPIKPATKALTLQRTHINHFSSTKRMMYTNFFFLKL